MKKILIVILLAVALFLVVQTSAVDAQSGEQVRITQVDASQLPHVTAYVSVTDASGAPIAIDPSRITLSENGAQMTPEQVRALGQPGSNGNSEAQTTLLVMDVSGSMGQAGKLDAAKAAARDYVNQLRPGDEVGLLAFNSQSNYIQPPTTDHQAMLAAINKLQAGGFTAMYDALTKAESSLANISGRKSIIVLTDGMDNRSTNTMDSVVKQIGPGGLSISVIGLGQPSQGTSSQAGIDQQVLQSLAGRAGGLYSYVTDSTALRKLYGQLGIAMQNEYAITYASPSTLRDGVNRSLSVSVVDPAGANLTATSQYNPGGVVPEVAQTNIGWQLFAIGLMILLALLLVPWVISRGTGLFRGAQPQSSRVRLVEPSVSGGSGPSQRPSLSQMVRNLFGRGKTKPSGRVRLTSSDRPHVRVH